MWRSSKLDSKRWMASEPVGSVPVGSRPRKVSGVRMSEARKPSVPVSSRRMR